MQVFLKFLLLFLIFINNSYSFETKAKEAFLMDFETGEIIFAKHAEEKVFPSSMTKIMTAYLIFEKLDNKEIKLTDEFYVSHNAWRQEGSRMFLNVNSKVSVNELLYGLLVQSGNDAAITLAEGCSGTVEKFVNEMNEKVEVLNLKNTHFTNPIGLSFEKHFMSVQDTAILSQKLIERFPYYYKKYFSVLQYKYNNILQANRNKLLGSYDSVDGIKTGHTEAGGYSMVNSAFKDNRRLISVINGVSSEQERIEEARNLLDYGFFTLKRFNIYEKNKIIKKIPILYGKNDAEVIVKNDIYATAENKDKINVFIKINDNLKAPIIKNQIIGTVEIKSEYETRTFNLYNENEIKTVNIFVKFYIFIKNLIAL